MDRVEWEKQLRHHLQQIRSLVEWYNADTQAQYNWWCYGGMPKDLYDLVEFINTKYQLIDGNY